MDKDANAIAFIRGEVAVVITANGTYVQQIYQDPDAGVRVYRMLNSFDSHEKIAPILESRNMIGPFAVGMRIVRVMASDSGVLL